MYVRSTAGIHMYAGAFHRNEIVPHFFTRSPADDTTSQLAELKVLGPADASTGDRSVEAGPPLPSPFLLASLASDRVCCTLLLFFSFPFFFHFGPCPYYSAACLLFWLY